MKYVLFDAELLNQIGTYDSTPFYRCLQYVHKEMDEDQALIDKSEIFYNRLFTSIKTITIKIYRINILEIVITEKDRKTQD